VPTEFLLGSEDQIEINVWKNPDLSRVTLIRPDGYVACRATLNNIAIIVAHLGKWLS
jgi:hypothetical protein